MRPAPLFVRKLLSLCAIALASRASATPTEAPRDSAAPDRETLTVDLSRIEARVRDAELVRLQIDAHRWELSHSRVAAEGVRFTDAFTTLGRRDLEPRLVAWSEIDRLEVGRTQLGRGAALGAVVGLASASIWFSIHPPKSDAGFLKFGLTSGGKTVLGTLLSTAFGAAMGAGVGGRMRRWETVYAAEGEAPATGGGP